MSASAETVALIEEKARFSRAETVRLIQIAKVGHFSSSFSCAEILATLYYGVMRLRRGEPDWPDRDRFLFGKGHAAAALYPLLADWDFFGKEVLDEYTRLGKPMLDLAGKKIVDAFRLWQQCEPRSLQHAHQRFVGAGFAAAHSARSEERRVGKECH